MGDMVISCTWNEIRGILFNELKKTNHIMTYGTIGSLNIESDIDTIVTKKPSSKSSDFFREVHDLFDKVDKYFGKESGVKLIRFSRFSHEEEVKFIGGYKKRDLLFHVMIYTSLDQMVMHWNDSLSLDEKGRGLTPSKKVRNTLKEGYQCIIGNVEDLFKADFKNNGNEEEFILLNDLDRINSHFPKKLLLDRMNVLFDYMFRKRLGQKTLEAKNEKEVREIFYKLCDILDELE